MNFFTKRKNSDFVDFVGQSQTPKGILSNGTSLVSLKTLKTMETPKGKSQNGQESKPKGVQKFWRSESLASSLKLQVETQRKVRIKTDKSLENLGKIEEFPSSKQTPLKSFRSNILERKGSMQVSLRVQTQNGENEGGKAKKSMESLDGESTNIPSGSPLYFRPSGTKSILKNKNKSLMSGLMFKSH